jgi:hypothetical protein
MKKIFLLFFLLAFSLGLNAQKEDQKLTFEGIGVFKLGMTKAELEKLINSKIILKHIGIDEVYTETVKAMYKGAEYEFQLMRNDNVVASLEGVSTTSPLYKTDEGIGVGSDQLTIINTYEKHLLMIGREAITYARENNLKSSIVFTMQNKKVVMITVEPTAMFRDRE